MNCLARDIVSHEIPDRLHDGVVEHLQAAAEAVATALLDRAANDDDDDDGVAEMAVTSILFHPCDDYDNTNVQNGHPNANQRDRHQSFPALQ